MELGAGWAAQITGGQCHCFLGNRQGCHLYSTPLSGWSSGVTWVATRHHPEYLSWGGFICLWATWIPQRGLRREVGVGRGSAQAWAGTEGQQGRGPRTNLGDGWLLVINPNYDKWTLFSSLCASIFLPWLWSSPGLLFSPLFTGQSLCFFKLPCRMWTGEEWMFGEHPSSVSAVGATRTACQECEPAGRRIQVFSQSLIIRPASI